MLRMRAWLGSISTSAWVVAMGMVAAAFSATLLAAQANAKSKGMSPGEVYRQAGPAVVLILGSDNGRSGAGGTGSIITADGKVVTNGHVVMNASGQPYKTLYVFLKPPRLTGDPKRDLTNRYKARVLAVSPDKELDLALLQIENPPAHLPTIAFADPDRVQIGDKAVAIGHPEQGGLWTLTTGVVSTVIANYGGVSGKNVFQTEASVNRGNSGGPLLDDSGAMIGINTMIARRGAGGVTITDVNFALKASVAVKWLAGKGMGLAYAPRRSRGGEPKEVVVAVAPEAKMAPRVTVAAQSKRPLSDPPAATIVIREKPPRKAQTVRSAGVKLGTEKAKQKVEAGKPLDVKKAKPTYHTEKRPFSIDELRRQQMKEMEDMMKDMRMKVKKKGGAGLW